jgi:hypothetical protein
VPDLLDGEDRAVLNKPPIKVAMDPKGDALKPASRLDLSKLHTVGYDIPIARLGKIGSRDVEDLRQYCGLSTSASQALDDLVEEDEEGDGEEYVERYNI